MYAIIFSYIYIDYVKRLQLGEKMCGGTVAAELSLNFAEFEVCTVGCATAERLPPRRLGFDSRARILTTFIPGL